MRYTRKIGPKLAGHPSIGQPCPACEKPFAEGCYTSMVTIGPGDDTHQRRLARLGRYYRAVVIEAHWGCVTGLDDDEDSYPGP
jgi:hypothetical protein